MLFYHLQAGSNRSYVHGGGEFGKGRHRLAGQVKENSYTFACSHLTNSSNPIGYNGRQFI